MLTQGVESLTLHITLNPFRGCNTGLTTGRLEKLFAARAMSTNSLDSPALQRSERPEASWYPRRSMFIEMESAGMLGVPRDEENLDPR